MRLSSISRIVKVRKFILLAQGRVGGTTLLRLLGAHPNVGYIDEPLWRKVESPGRKLEHHALKSWMKGKVFGCKIKHWHLTRVQEMESAVPFFQRAVSDGWLIVRLKRENIVKQALAGLAREHGKGLGYHNDPAVRIEIPLEEVGPAVAQRAKHTREEDMVVKEIPALHLSYERDILDPSRRQSACDRVFANLGLPSHSVSSVCVSTESDTLSDFVSNASEIEDYLRRQGLSYSDKEFLRKGGYTDWGRVSEESSTKRVRSLISLDS